MGNTAILLKNLGDIQNITLAELFNLYTFVGLEQQLYLVNLTKTGSIYWYAIWLNKRQVKINTKIKTLEALKKELKRECQKLGLKERNNNPNKLNNLLKNLGIVK